MNWNDLYASNCQPTVDDMAEYIGGEGEALWRELFAYMERAYKAKPKLSYSGCSMKPGWNVKFAKSGQSFGTLYPEEGRFSVFVVISYKLAEAMEQALDGFSPAMREYWANAQDYMKLGRFMMFPVRTQEDLEDYKRIAAIKLMPKEG